MVSMDFTDQEVALILAGLFELTITYVENDEKRQRSRSWPASSAATRTRCSFGRDY
jgi:hypothetical protein